ncbi:glycosyltransferase family 4 protein [Candidatus Uhrbacteria bacterium]|nr:glycosyltransferase family 4 protein [Candidatus Uhrbacteria bacterium]
MTIGIDASRAFRGKKTGTEWYSYHVIQEIVRQNQSDLIVLYVDRKVTSEEIGFDIPQSVKIKYLGWPIRRLWTQGRLSLEMLIHSPDVLFVPSHAIPLIHPKKTVTTIHDVGFLQYPESYSQKDLRYLQWSTQYAVENASSLITVSEFSKRELISHYRASQQKIHVIHLGYDEDIYHPYPQDEILPVQKKYHLHTPYLLCIARLESRKNIPFFIDVFDVMKENGYAGEFVLIGQEGYDAKKILNRIKASPFASSIHYLGWIEEKEKATLLSGADCLVFPSLYEGFGLPLLEAQGCGIPVITSNTTSLPEVGGDGALYCNPTVISEWVEKFQNIMADADLKDSMRQKGFENIKRFSWQETAAQTLKIIVMNLYA